MMDMLLPTSKSHTCVIILTFSAHAQPGLQYLVCVSLSVCLSTTILALQATRRLMSDMNSFSATRALKTDEGIFLKRLR